jgi:hypothetical protein
VKRLLITGGPASSAPTPATTQDSTDFSIRNEEQLDAAAHLRYPEELADRRC